MPLSLHVLRARYLGTSDRDFNATQYPRITEALIRKGYSEQTIRKILGENWLRLLKSANVSGAPTASK